MEKNNVVNLFKGQKSPTEEFRNYERQTDAAMNRGGLEVGIISIARMDYLHMKSHYDLSVYLRRLEIALRYLRPTLAVYDVPFPEAQYNFIINRHDQEVTSFNIVLTRKDLPEPIILRAEVLDNGVWEAGESNENIPFPTFENDGYDSVYWAMLKSQDRMVNLGVAKKTISCYNLLDLEYHLSAYTYLRTEDNVNVTIGIMGLINEHKYTESEHDDSTPA